MVRPIGGQDIEYHTEHQERLQIQSKKRNSDSSSRLCLCFCVGGGWERGEEEQQQQQQRRILVEAPLPLHGPSGAGLKRSHGRPNGRQNKWMGSVREERRDGGGEMERGRREGKWRGWRGKRVLTCRAAAHTDAICSAHLCLFSSLLCSL